MKKCLLFAIAIIYPGWIFSQCTPTTNTVPGVIPSIQDNLPYAYVGNYYSTILQVRTPLDTTVNGTYVKLTSVRINGIANLPAGFSYTCNPSNNTIGPLQNGCMELTGNPTLALAGTYLLDVDMTVSGKLYGVIPVSQQTKLSDYKIKIYGPPVANFYADKNTSCVGEPISFNDNSTNKPTSYLWTFTGGTPSTSTLENPLVTYSASGNYTIKLKVTSPAGTNTKIITSLIHINSAPVASLVSYTTDTVCSGDSTLLEAVPINGCSYQWYRNNILLPGAVNSTYYAKSNGSYNVEVRKASGGCSSMSSPKTISKLTINANVTPVGSLKVCAPGAVTLLAQNKPNLTYTWYRNNKVITGAKTASYVANSTGYYKVQISNLLGCKDISTPSHVTINLKPNSSIVALGPTTFCKGDSVTLKNGSTVTNATYKWLRNNVLINGATDRRFDAKLRGFYTSIATSPQGCTRISPRQYITVNCRLEQENDNVTGMPVTISPNPAEDNAIIAFENYEPDQVTISLYDAIGKLKTVVSKGNYQSGEHEISLNTTGYPAGLYFVRIESKQENKTVKLIIKK